MFSVCEYIMIVFCTSVLLWPKKSALPQIQVSVSEVPSLGLKAAELATSLTQKYYMATIFLSGCISKALGWAMNFSPLFRFKYILTKQKLLRILPPLCTCKLQQALPPAPYFVDGKVIAYQITNAFLCHSIKILLISAGLVSCVILTIIPP